MVASPGHPELMLGRKKKKKKKCLKRCGLIPQTFVLGSELYLTILHKTNRTAIIGALQKSTTDNCTIIL